MTNKFTESYIRFVSGGGKMTMVSPEEMCSNFTLAEDEIEVFMKYGGTDINKTEKSKEEVLKDKDVFLQSGLETTDPRNLLRQSVCDN